MLTNPQTVAHPPPWKQRLPCLSPTRACGSWGRPSRKRITLASAEEVSSFVGKVLEEDELDLLREGVQVLCHEPG